MTSSWGGMAHLSAASRLNTLGGRRQAIIRCRESDAGNGVPHGGRTFAVQVIGCQVQMASASSTGSTFQSHKLMFAEDQLPVRISYLCRIVKGSR